jgi:hypothetical protein
MSASTNFLPILWKGPGIKQDKLKGVLVVYQPGDIIKDSDTLDAATVAKLIEQGHARKYDLDRNGQIRPLPGEILPRGDLSDEEIDQEVCDAEQNAEVSANLLKLGATKEPTAPAAQKAAAQSDGAKALP